MSQITAAAVKALREKTSLPLMECKRALTECDGDEAAAIDWLREQGQKVAIKRAGRETSFGRFGLFCGHDHATGAMVELKCESAPVTQSDEFINFANELAEQLAGAADVTDVDGLLALPSKSHAGKTLGEVKDDMFNRIREVFNVGRMVRVDGTCGGYSHNSGTVSGVLVEVEGGNSEAARDISMHVAAMRPAALTTEELDADEVEKERALLRDAALKEGKPENIVDKMVEGRLRNFFAERVLLEQPFVKDDKQSVGKYAKSQGMEVKKFFHWELGDDGPSGDGEAEA